MRQAIPAIAKLALKLAKNEDMVCRKKRVIFPRSTKEYIQIREGSKRHDTLVAKLKGEIRDRIPYAGF